MIKQVLSKLRRVTMSLFAVLCAGAVWAGEGEVLDLNSLVRSTDGYVITGLGAGGNEIAVVFTNTAQIIQWQSPVTFNNVEFLAVGGGGGGGGYGKTTDVGGAGGGGGGVATGVINSITPNAIFSIDIGEGGAGGVAGNNNGAASKGEDTSFAINSVNCLTAFGGGADIGENATPGNNTDDVGGSNAGSRTTTQNSTQPKRAISHSQELLSNVQVFGSLGGKRAFDKAAGGGGGAIQNGANSYNASSSNRYTGGHGGDGIELHITGSKILYGAGGGGGTGDDDSKQGYTSGDGGGGGSGGSKDSRHGANAFANRGGGGGGAGCNNTSYGNGGRGGSGVFILRLSLPKKPVTPHSKYRIPFEWHRP